MEQRRDGGTVSDDNEFAFASGKGNVEKFRRVTVMIAPAEHGLGEIAGDR
jgi:hypothetical protein